MDRRVRTAIFAIISIFFAQGFALGAPVSPLRAVQAAGAALAMGVDRAASGSARIAFSQAEPTVTPRMQDGRVVYYTVADPSGWAVVAADDAVYPVLAYSDKPVDPSVAPPPAYVWWMDQTAAQISSVIAMGLKAGPEVEEAWATLEPTADLTPMAPGDVGPLMSTTWNQGTGYNTYTPVDANATSSGGRVWAGCVATTMAQIMKYYNWPVQGVGTHSDTNSGYGTLTVSPGNTTYAWSSMTLNSGSTASALLMYHAGVAANMRYGASGSGATVENARLGFIDHFRYKSSATHVYRGNYDQATWTALVKAELDAARPIFYAGYNASSGHAFVVDGYRAADGLFHLNWGWGSAYDGYFQLNALNPGSYTFNLYQEAIFGIAPDDRTVVARPTFSVAPGTYNSARSVQLSCATVGASLRYTLDNTVPTETNGTLYNLTTRPAIAISTTKTLRAVAFKTGMAQSYQAAGTYTIVTAVAAAPTMSPPAGTYSAGQTVALASATAGATIRYTTDGSTPSQFAGTVYTGPISVGVSQTIRAIAYKSGYNAQSALATGTYSIVAATAAAPKASLVQGTYSGSKSVTLSTTTAGAVIKYTLDGTTPTQWNGTTYSAAFSISSTKTLKAIAYKAGTHASSPILTATIRIVSPTAALPTFSLAAGTYAGSQTLTITCSTPGAYIYYTVNGTTPTQVGNRYTVPLTIASSQTVNAIAVVPSAYGQSAIKAAAYSIVAGVAAAPKASLVAGTYTGAKTVTLSTTTVGAVIKYTLDGTIPSQTTGTTYSIGISISSTKTLRAIAYKAGSYASSAILGVSYKIVTSTAAIPTFSLAAGTYTTSKTLSMTCSTAGANIHYTTNGTTPTQASTKYTTPLTIGSTQTVNAIAVVAATHGQSAVRSAAYTINLVGEPLAARAPVEEDPPVADIFGTEDFVTLEAGAFNMGSPEGQGSPNEYPLHEAVIEEPFAILKREVTAAQFTQLMGEGLWSDPACPQCPATFVSREDAVEFVARLNLMSGEALYALPTETQWEYAARGGQYSLGRIYPGADTEEDLSAIAWFAGVGATETTVTGSLTPNELGLFDMAGNAAEWVSDDYSPYGATPVPLGFGLLRGGSYADAYADLRCASRKAAPVDERSGGYGFRLVRAIR